MDSLLYKHVSTEGRVDYPGFIQDRPRLDQYMDLLSAHHPNDKYWSPDEQMAYWINAYNAFTVILILDHYPIQSIKDIKKGIPFINSVWDIRNINIEGEVYDLNKIEHSILRKKFKDPKVHFAINCASHSCPKLSNRAYLSNGLEEQLKLATTNFLQDTTKNILSKQALSLSKIFKWFGSDFKAHGSIQQFILTHQSLEINPTASIHFLPYNWSLNE